MTFRRANPAIIAVSIIVMLSAAAGLSDPVQSAADPTDIRSLIVGGGPDKQDNEIAIESNVRYVRGLLKPRGPVRVLFANGDLNSKNVQIEDPNGNQAYRASTLGQIDGPSTAVALNKQIEGLAGGSSPVLLYFTGHGSPDREEMFADNAYDLWQNDTFTVSDLSTALDLIGKTTPTVVVMVQCFSGAFSAAFFPAAGATPPVRPQSCGFFASLAQREAAGCTSEVDEADYHDFTTYFFGALSGHDRVGRPVLGADYDRDGAVEMDEAYAYALINDRSIDTPEATTDAYVRRYTHIPDSQIFKTSYQTVLDECLPWQRAVLDGLSQQLLLGGDNRLKYAYHIFLKRVTINEDTQAEDDEERAVRWIRFVRMAKTVILEHEILQNGKTEVAEGLKSLMAVEHTNPLGVSP